MREYNILQLRFKELYNYSVFPDEDKTDSGGDKDTKPSISTDALISSSPSLSLTPTLLFSLPLLLTYLASRY